MHILRSFSATKKACYLGYITQAITINFAPLLFLTFESEFEISLSQISLLIGINFTVQLLTDLTSAKFLPRVSLRGTAIATQLFAAVGILGLAFFPAVMPTPYSGLVLAVLFCGIGGGLSEVLISPLIEACPSENKTSSMSFLHSFYCWGQAGVILLSVLFFATAGIAHWRMLACLFAAVPLVGAFLFCMVPIPTFGSEEGGLPLSRLFTKRLFWLLLVMIAVGGAAEMVMSQWASSFAESGLGVSKTVGDLLGPCLFAVLMGLSRLLCGVFADRIPLQVSIPVSGVLCIVAYLMAALAQNPMLALCGCGLCGLSVGVFWPGIYSLAARALPEGGVPMFAILALAGDVGCLLGPSVSGRIADANGGDLRLPFLLATALPVVLLLAAFCLFRTLKRATPGAGSGE